MTVNVPDWLAARARARGVSVEVYIEEMLARQSSRVSDEGRLQSAGAAIDRIREMRKGNTLAGLSTKDMIHEGHKY
ncbi:MAG TPA: hypothetical protein VHX49_10030 [Candidatus Acidoferrales bacterium]|nr:hypothetical protein [Candidatus Acidoferrales bacterium]